MVRNNDRFADRRIACSLQVASIVHENLQQRASAGGASASTSSAASACEAVLDHIRQGRQDGTLDGHVDDMSIVVLLLDEQLR